MNTYPKTIKAALAETKSKFDLAAAILSEIPEGNNGSDSNVLAQLEAMSIEIEDNGAEARSASTLGKYRFAAMFAHTARGVEWRKGASFSAHSEAAQYGVDREWFYKVQRTIADVRKSVGARPQHAAVNVAEMSVLEKVEFMQQLAADDPKTAADVVAKANAADLVKGAHKEIAKAKPDNTPPRALQTGKDIGKLVSEMEREARSLSRFLAPRWAEFADKHWSEMSSRETDKVKASLDSMRESIDLIANAIGINA